LTKTIVFVFDRRVEETRGGDIRRGALKLEFGSAFDEVFDCSEAVAVKTVNTNARAKTHKTALKTNFPIFFGDLPSPI
jgi:hypothetical protein